MYTWSRCLLYKVRMGLRQKHARNATVLRPTFVGTMHAHYNTRVYKPLVWHNRSKLKFSIIFYVPNRIFLARANYRAYFILNEFLNKYTRCTHLFCE